ncbi:Homeobox domain-containing protein [Psidium guajava]|nr:Homeobox domain-containing protein [Psidium guajava]
MGDLPRSPSSLELTISVPGFSSSPPLPSTVRDLDINQVPSGGEEEWMTMSGGGMEDEEESSHGGPPRKKLRLTKEQSRLLEESFRQNHTLNPKQKEALATQLKLRPRQVEVWFQNRRARSKLKQTEMECEYLKRVVRIVDGAKPASPKGGGGAPRPQSGPAHRHLPPHMPAPPGLQPHHVPSLRARHLHRPHRHLCPFCHLEATQSVTTVGACTSIEAAIRRLLVQRVEINT